MSKLDFRYCKNCNEPLNQSGWSKDKKLCNRNCIDQYVKFVRRLDATKIKCETILKEISSLNRKYNKIESDPIITKQKETEMKKIFNKTRELRNKYKNLKCFIKHAITKLDDGYPAQKLNTELSKTKRGEHYLPIPMVVLQK